MTIPDPRGNPEEVVEEVSEVRARISPTRLEWEERDEKTLIEGWRLRTACAKSKPEGRDAARGAGQPSSAGARTK